MANEHMHSGDDWRDDFEKLYICTYSDVYRHICRRVSQRDQVRELMVRTYVAAYLDTRLREQMRASLQEELTEQTGISEKNEKQQSIAVEWLEEKADELARKQFGVSPEEIETAAAAEKMYENEGAADVSMNIDETSIFLEIGDRLPAEDNDSKDTLGGMIVSLLKYALSLAVLVGAVYVLVFSLQILKGHWEGLRGPLLESLVDAEKIETESPDEEITLRLKDKIAYLSEIGEILYIVPLEEAEWDEKLVDNPEILEHGEWVYYLPCPEREDTLLNDVSSELFHTLYRMRDDGKRIQIIEQQVEDFTFWNDELYVYKEGRVHRIDKESHFEEYVPGIYAKDLDGEWYLYDTLGRTLVTDAEGNVHFEDRVYKLSSGRVVGVEPDVREKDGIIYELRLISRQDDEYAIYRIENDEEELFARGQRTIDSFCIVGDWLYYSACVRRATTQKNYSSLYRKSLTEDAGEELLLERFPGRVWQLYYSENTEKLYGNYTPRNWESAYGEIAVFSKDGEMYCLDGGEARLTRETTGDDALEFVIAQDGKICCYWQNQYWKRRQEPTAIWRDTLMFLDDRSLNLSKDQDEEEDEWEDEIELENDLTMPAE